MADSSSDRKKSVFILLLAFLLAGGGIFLFFIIQGADDLKGEKNKNFEYGTVVRNSVAPFFKYLGIAGDDDEKFAAATRERMKNRGLLDEDGHPKVDVSDWMAKEAPPPDGSPAGPAPGRSASAAPPRNIPRMEGGGMGGLPSGGGGSKSSGGGGRFESGSQAGALRVPAGGAGGGEAPGKGKGLLNSLRGSQAVLGEGLRSDSAMTAKSKWDQSFGVGSTGRTGGGGGGAPAYGKSGLVSLDKIKSGDISDLKLTGSPGHGGIPAVSPPKPNSPDGEGETGIAKRGDLSQIGQQLAGNLTSGIGAGTGTGAGTDHDVAGGAGAPQPPANIRNVAETTVENGGLYCPNGCPQGSQYQYKDNPPTYQQQGDLWTVTYTGTQTLAGGNTVSYSDTMVITPGGNPPLTCLNSTVNGQPVPDCGGL